LPIAPVGPPTDAALAPLARFYFLAYAGVGITLPYLPLHLKALGLSGADIGLLLGLGPLAAMLFPPVWGYLADKTRRAGELLSAATCGSALAWAPLLFATQRISIAPWLALQALFSSPVAMLADSLTLERVRGAGGLYSRVRLWGSVGFIATALGFGLLYDGERASPPKVIVAALGMGALSFLASLKVRGPAAARPSPRILEVASLLRDGRVRRLLAATTLHWIAFSPYNILFTVHLKDLGLGPTVAGMGLATGVLAEVAVMGAYRNLAARVSAPRILLVSFAASSVRWLLLGLSSSAVPMVLLQVAHGLSFGAFMVTSVAYLATLVPARLRATGQALYVCTTYGLGGLIGNVVTGHLYDLWPARAIFFAAAAVELLPALLASTLPPSATPREARPEVGFEATP
jgi:PPP family 3-phenylpropionic acid transporter